MATTVPTKSVNFEEALLKFFDERQIDKKFLSTYTKSIARLQASGVEIINVLDRGTPVPDWVLVTGRMKVADFSKLKDAFILPKMRGFEVFPIGIINPELQLAFKFGNAPH